MPIDPESGGTWIAANDAGVVFALEITHAWGLLLPLLLAVPTLGAHLNAIFCRDGIPERFATLVYAEFGPGDGAVAIMNAGHPMPVVVANERAEGLAPVALPVVGLRMKSNSEMTRSPSDGL